MSASEDSHAAQAVAAVEVTGLRMAYGDAIAVDGASFTAPRGAVTAVLGPNGAGKTTTLETCEGFRTPQDGEVKVLGLPPASAELRSRVGVMLQEGGVWSGVKAMPMLRHVAALYANPLDADALGARLGIDRVRATYRRMSGGEKQRLALACAIVGRPELVFLDEPSAGLDPQARLAVWQLIRDLRAAGTSIVLTTHLMTEAEELADHIVILDKGRVVAQGSLDELTTTADGLTFRSGIGLDVPGLLAALPAGSTAVEFSPGAYRVEGEITPREIAAVTAWCSSQGATLRDLNVGRRSLEELFLELTGRELTP